MSINQTVNVNSYYFTQNLRAFPREIEFNNTRYTFQDGLQYSVGKGQEAIRLYDMTDGQTTFRLKQLRDTWTLISTRA